MKNKELTFEELITGLDEFNTIDNFLCHWDKIVGHVYDVKNFYNSCLYLTKDELLEARTSLILHGKTTNDYELFISKFEKGYSFVGRFFKPKTIRNILEQGRSRGTAKYL